MIRISWKTPWLSRPPNVQRVSPYEKRLPIITRKSSSGNAITRSVKREIDAVDEPAEVAGDRPEHDPDQERERAPRRPRPRARRGRRRGCAGTRRGRAGCRRRAAAASCGVPFGGGVCWNANGSSSATSRRVPGDGERPGRPQRDADRVREEVVRPVPDRLRVERRARADGEQDDEQEDRRSRARPGRA